MSLNVFKKQHFGNEPLQRLQDNVEQFLRQLYNYPSAPAGLDSFRLAKPALEVTSSSPKKVIIRGSADKPSIFQISNNLYSIKTDLFCDLSASGAGGLDQGSLSVSKTYFIYALTQGNAIRLIASTSNPIQGPLGFENTTYLGSISTKSGSTDLIPCVVNNGFLLFDEPLETESHTGDTSATVKTFSQLPEIAKMAYVELKVSGTSVGTFGKAGGSTSVSALSGYTQVSGVENVSHGFIPILESQKIYLKLENSANTVACSLLGWVDETLRFK